MLKKKRKSIESCRKIPGFIAISRASIIWTYLSMMRNQSFNFCNFSSDYFPRMFLDSQTANNTKLYRQKIQKILTIGK